MTLSKTGCCARARVDEAKARNAVSIVGGGGVYNGAVIEMPGDAALIGPVLPQFPDDGKGPTRRKDLTPFRVSATTIKNEGFAAFLNQTSHFDQSRIAAYMGNTTDRSISQQWVGVMCDAA